MEQSARNGSQLVEVEEVDAVLIGEPRPLPAQRSTAEVVRTQAAVVAGSFAVGAVTAVVVAHRRARRASGKAARTRRGPGLDVAASRSFLVDVHLLNRKP
jgi:hypothetical protein